VITKIISDNPEWKDKLHANGVVLDKENPIAVHPHIETFEFDKISHVLKAQSFCDLEYGLTQVPLLVLTDKTGKLAFKGNPIDIGDFESAINGLIADDKIPEGIITNHLIENSHTAADEGDLKKVYDATKTIWDDKLLDLDDEAQELVQASIVYINEQLVDPMTSESLFETHCILNFVGKPEKIDVLIAKASPIMAEIVKETGFFPVMDQCTRYTEEQQKEYDDTMQKMKEKYQMAQDAVEASKMKKVEEVD
jgi:hypothetical protein